MFKSLIELRLAGLAVITSAVVTLGIERFCVRVGLYDWPGARKMQTVPVPRMGGLAFVLTSFAFGLAFSLRAPLILWVGAAIVFAGGLLDDVRITNSVIGKIFFQIPAAFFFTQGCDVATLGLQGVPALAFKVLIFGFVFFMTNAANLMDNMNGLTAGLAVLVTFGFSLLSWSVLGDPSFAAIGFIVCASVIGFGFRNFPAGKIYMGDQGSQFLGFFTASYAVLFWLRLGTVNPEVSIWKGSLLLAAPFVLFIYDVVSTVRIRLREGRSPFVGDQCHISHRLVRFGFSPTKAVLVLFGVQALITAASAALTAIVARG